MLEMKTDQDTPIALGEVDSKRVEIAMAPEGTGDGGRDGDGGYCGIEEDLVRAQGSKESILSCPECIIPWHGGREC